MSLRIGLIGLDTSHVMSFAEILNKGQVPGGQIVCGVPAASPDMPVSINRVAGFTKRLQDEYGVAILDSPAAVAAQADLVFITAVDGRAHRRQFAEIAKFKKPVFIDKPFAVTVADAQAIADLAAEHNVPVVSCSGLRYVEALRTTADHGRILGLDVYGPLDFQPPTPGYFWYGIHGIEMIVATLGVGCRRVHVTATDDYDLVTFAWSDGRSAFYRGLRKAHWQFGAVVHHQKTSRQVDAAAAKRSPTVCMLEAILRTLPAGKSDVPVAETLEIVRIICAANQSRETGQPVAVG
ncbi:MAG: hypothetical protein PCFJNLEI_03141 [Verrucomicrobiae bacterium]|nr:hypothetical protein [Verrucomicrobiae bacterium]